MVRFAVWILVANCILLAAGAASLPIDSAESVIVVGQAMTKDGQPPSDFDWGVSAVVHVGNSPEQVVPGRFIGQIYWVKVPAKSDVTLYFTSKSYHARPVRKVVPTQDDNEPVPGAYISVSSPAIMSKNLQALIFNTDKAERDAVAGNVSVQSLTDESNEYLETCLAVGDRHAAAYYLIANEVAFPKFARNFADYRKGPLVSALGLPDRTEEQRVAQVISKAYTMQMPDRLKGGPDLQPYEFVDLIATDGTTGLNDAAIMASCRLDWGSAAKNKLIGSYESLATSPSSTSKFAALYALAIVSPETYHLVVHKNLTHKLSPTGSFPAGEEWVVITTLNQVKKSKYAIAAPEIAGLILNSGSNRYVVDFGVSVLDEIRATDDRSLQAFSKILSDPTASLDARVHSAKALSRIDNLAAEYANPLNRALKSTSALQDAVKK